MVRDCTLSQRLGSWQVPPSSLSAGIHTVHMLRASCDFADGCAVTCRVRVFETNGTFRSRGNQAHQQSKKEVCGQSHDARSGPSHCQRPERLWAVTWAACAGPLGPPGRVHSPLPEPRGSARGDRGASDISGHAGCSNKALGSLNKEDMGFSQWPGGGHFLLCPHMTQGVTSGHFLFF